MKRAVIIAAKALTSEIVGNDLSPKSFQELAAALLQDAAVKAKRICQNIFIAFSAPAAAGDLKRFLPENDFKFIEPAGKSAGERVFEAFEAAFAANFDEVLMLFTDSPTVPADYLELAFEFLETNSDVVLGKTTSGGVYLVGLRALQKEIFENIEWKRGGEFEKLFDNAHALGLHLRETPEWYAVGAEKDLLQLKEEFLHNENARRRAAKTFEWINKWGKF